jgi:hypothetical protein
MTTTAPKAIATTTKRSAGQIRLNSDDSRTNSSVSIIIEGNRKESMHTEPLKIITEVDGRITKNNI